MKAIRRSETVEVTQVVEPGEAMMNLLLGAVPERQAELKDLWAAYGPDVRVVEDGPLLRLSTKGRRITFSSKTMDVYWLIGLNGWLTLEAYSPAIVLSVLSGRTIASVLEADNDVGEFERAYRERRAAAKSLAETIDVSDAPWPPDVPRPRADRKAPSGYAIPEAQYETAFDLTLLAVAGLLLHELRHVMLAADGPKFKDLRDEEMACDVWARDFMTAKAALYAERYDHAYSDVIRKRSMALAFSSAMIHDTTPFWERCGSEAYYPVRDRVKALVGATPLAPDDCFWVVAACLMLGMRREAGLHVEIRADDWKALAGASVDEL